MDTRWIKKFRLLVAALILSCGLNVGLLAAFVVSKWEDSAPNIIATRLSSSADISESSCSKALASLCRLSFAELVVFLTNKEPVEQGLLKRDLAVSSLVAFYDFDLEKALSSPPSQIREISFAGDQKVAIYPGLDDEQFDAIIRFAYREKWPLTSKGLFSLLKKKEPFQRDESLSSAFFSTAEFYALQLLFQKTQAPQPAETLLNLSLEGSWKTLEQFTKEQAQLLDLSVEKRRNLLLNYIHEYSKTAAQLLLKTDFSYGKQKLDDGTLLQMIPLLTEKTAESEKFCLEILSSPRTDPVLKAASERLYAFAGEAIPAPFLLKEAISRFTSQTHPAVLMSNSAPPLRQHVVKEGENLWKIARQHKVKVDELVKLNELEKDQLYPGMILIIP